MGKNIYKNDCTPHLPDDYTVDNFEYGADKLNENKQKENEKAMYHFTLDSYKDIRNYIHNFLGIRKEEIREMFWDFIKEMVQEEVAKALNDEEKIQSIIEKEVIRQIKFNSNDKRSVYLVRTMDAVYSKIDKVIHDEVIKRLKVELRSPEEIAQLDDKDIEGNNPYEMYYN